MDVSDLVQSDLLGIRLKGQIVRQVRSAHGLQICGAHAVLGLHGPQMWGQNRLQPDDRELRLDTDMGTQHLPGTPVAQGLSESNRIRFGIQSRCAVSFPPARQ